MNTKEVKDFYNQDIAKAKNYEERRWFKNDISRVAYEATKNAVKRCLFGLSYKKCLELGPGHGTWTKELLKKNPKAKYDLVDISSQMLSLVRERFKEHDNIKFFESDFLKFNTKEKYDFFFSSRAIEYIPDKKEVVKKIYNLLGEGGEGFIITKTPKYWRAKILRRKISSFHSGQISPWKLRKIMEEQGFKVLDLRPVVMSWPFWRSAKMNKMLNKICVQFKLNFLSQFFSESYSIYFKK